MIHRLILTTGFILSLCIIFLLVWFSTKQEEKLKLKTIAHTLPSCQVYQQIVKKVSDRCVVVKCYFDKQSKEEGNFDKITIYPSQKLHNLYAIPYYLYKACFDSKNRNIIEYRRINKIYLTNEYFEKIKKYSLITFNKANKDNKSMY